MSKDNWRSVRREFAVREQPILSLQSCNLGQLLISVRNTRLQLTDSPTVLHELWPNQSAHATEATAALFSEIEQEEAGKQP